MSPELTDQISRIAKAAKVWHELEAGINDADVLINGSNNWLAQITQEELDSVPRFQAAHVTVDDVTTGLYILKTMNAIPAATNIAAWVKMANLS